MREFMLLAIEEARKGVKCGDGGPFGAVIIHENKIISKAHNTVIQSNDQQHMLKLMRLGLLRSS